MLQIEAAQDHIRRVFFGWPITVISADEQIQQMMPPSVFEMVAEDLEDAAKENDLSEMQS